VRVARATNRLTAKCHLHEGWHVGVTQGWPGCGLPFGSGGFRLTWRITPQGVDLVNLEPQRRILCWRPRAAGMRVSGQGLSVHFAGRFTVDNVESVTRLARDPTLTCERTIMMHHFIRVYTRAFFLLSLLSGAALTASAADAAAALEKKPKWESSATAGLTLTTGNTETFLGAAAIMSKRKWQQNEISLGVDGTYGETKLRGASESTRNAESVHGFAQYNRLFNERLFGYARMDMLHDAVADVDYRLSVSPGLGYYFIKREKIDLTGEVGPGFIYEQLASGTDSYMSLRLAERFNYKFAAKARLWESIEVLPQVDRFGNFLLNFELGVEASLTEKFKLRTFIQDTYDHEPAPSRKRNDLKWVTGLGYDF